MTTEALTPDEALATHTMVDDDTDGPQDAYCTRCLGNRALILEGAVPCPAAESAE